MLYFRLPEFRPLLCSLQVSYCKVPFVKPKWLLLLGRCSRSLKELAALLLNGMGSGGAFSCLPSFPAVRTFPMISLFFVGGVTDLAHIWINLDCLSYSNIKFPSHFLQPQCILCPLLLLLLTPFVKSLPLFPGTVVLLALLNNHGTILSQTLNKVGSCKVMF